MDFASITADATIDRIEALRITMQIHGIHHVTAVTRELEHNIEFYTDTMGMRLVKKSINQDDAKIYHLFYADAVASPGTDFTFFDWRNIGNTTLGGGMVGITMFRVAGESALDWWQERLEAAHLPVDRGVNGNERPVLMFADPEGQSIQLVDDTGLQGASTQPWDKIVPAEYSLRGLLGVELMSLNPDGTRAYLKEILGFTRVRDSEVDQWEVAEEDSIVQVTIGDGRIRRGRVGGGSVHHVAFRVSDEDELRAFERHLNEKNLPHSGLIDRHYFKSLYMREPGGVLLELATDGPGMTVDEPLESLGTKISIPPKFDDRRAEIEAGLRPLPLPAYDRAPESLP